MLGFQLWIYLYCVRCGAGWLMATQRRSAVRGAFLIPLPGRGITNVQKVLTLLTINKGYLRFFEFYKLPFLRMDRRGTRRRILDGNRVFLFSPSISEIRFNLIFVNISKGTT